MHPKKTRYTARMRIEKYFENNSKKCSRNLEMSEKMRIFAVQFKKKIASIFDNLNKTFPERLSSVCISNKRDLKYLLQNGNKNEAQPEEQLLIAYLSKTFLQNILPGCNSSSSNPECSLLVDNLCGTVLEWFLQIGKASKRFLEYRLFLDKSIF